ncbi:predicted protein [Uncinocarpus reesii 1704]|uniref:Chromo domain-containing protein n=1 Tax=Uncinocarpus reesii (strain UAMH 1704) TaxID=336963 RepID=C4JXF7_UNCRE|nr:uncharacterized protein UREG_06330 [Uncinocarpus reesii 1704]EEP81465.1 predicted protein [Uncinocarpus reesii 1704]
MGRKCLSVRPGSWQKFKRFHFSFNVSERDKANLKNVKRFTRHLQNSNIIRLDISVTSYSSWINPLLDVQGSYDTIRLYLDAFRQVGRAREARALLRPDPSVKLKEIEDLTESASVKTEAIAIASGWRRYYEDWVENLKRGRLMETPFTRESSPLPIPMEQDEETEEEFQVYTILDSRIRRDCNNGTFYLEYKVDWSLDYPSWEPFGNVVPGCEELVEEFHARYPDKPNLATLTQLEEQMRQNVL